MLQRCRFAEKLSSLTEAQTLESGSPRLTKMSRAQTCEQGIYENHRVAPTLMDMRMIDSQTTGEAAASQQTKSNTGSKVRSLSVALLVLCVLLAAAAVVIYRLLSEHFQIKENLQLLKDENEAMRKNLTAEPCPSCETGWDQHEGRCYYFSSRKLTWTQSRGDCKGRGADLVQIDSEEEQWFLEYRVRKKMNERYDRFWIGLTDAEVEGRWLWVDGSLLNTSLSFWGPKQPDNYSGDEAEGEDCARMGLKGGAEGPKSWFDRVCNDPQRRICEKQAAPRCHNDAHD